MRAICARPNCARISAETAPCPAGWISSPFSAIGRGAILAHPAVAQAWRGAPRGKRGLSMRRSASPKKGSTARPRRKAAARKRSLLRRFLPRARPALRILAWSMGGILLWVMLYRFVPVPGGIYMAQEAIRLGGIERQWRPMDAISPHLARSVMAAEDARFCDHWGFDFEEIRRAMAQRESGRIRGASTISQQVAKNVFLWHGRSWARKGLEAGFTTLVEALWPKRRILEVYLNTAEFDAGVFGAEAASTHYIGLGADTLSVPQADHIASHAH